MVIFAATTAPLSGCCHESVLDPLDNANHFAILFKVRGAKELSKHVPLVVCKCSFVNANASVIAVRMCKGIAHESNTDPLRPRNVAHIRSAAFLEDSTAGLIVLHPPEGDRPPENLLHEVLARMVLILENRRY